MNRNYFYCIGSFHIYKWNYLLVDSPQDGNMSLQDREKTGNLSLM